MEQQPKIASAAFLIADPARAAMLMSLLDGRARPAGELAFAAGVTPQTASSHLSKLLSGGLMTVETQGRHRYYRLSGSHVALALENLASIGVTDAMRRKPPGKEAQRLQFARCCYDHLAGRIGVAIAQSLQARLLLLASTNKCYKVTPAGIEWFSRMGLDVTALKPNRGVLARQCLDWSEREHHVAGPLGVQLLKLLCSNGWAKRSELTRAVQITPKGCVALKAQLGIDAASLALVV